MRSLAIGATGMLAQQTNVDVISNNIANMNTTAYTKRRAEFNDLLYQNIIRPGSASTSSDTIVPSGIQHTSIRVYSHCIYPFCLCISSFCLQFL